MAELRVPETQVKDVTIGLLVAVDTRNGIVAGKVIRIDPAVVEGTVQVDVELTGKLPRGARPDQSVDGTIEIERLAGRRQDGPVARTASANSTVTLFKLVDEGEYAVRVPVQLGVTSVNEVEIVQGLAPGDEVILSDTSAWDDVRSHPAELTMLANLLHDVRYALHGFALRPMFAVVVVLTLAIGIGVNVAVFSLFDRIMLRELNVANPRELVKLVIPGRRPRQSNQQRAGARRRDVQLPDVPRPRERRRAVRRIWPRAE